MNLDVARDENGQPVTITPAQLGAIWHAVEVVETVRRSAGYPSMFENARADPYKSRLLGRMLLDGRAPLEEAPPRYLGAPGYHFVEPDLPHHYLGRVFLATVLEDDTIVPYTPLDPEG